MVMTPSNCRAAAAAPPRCSDLISPPVHGLERALRLRIWRKRRGDKRFAVYRNREERADGRTQNRVLVSKSGGEFTVIILGVL
jgi:hypothetical protein